MSATTTVEVTELEVMPASLSHHQPVRPNGSLEFSRIVYSDGGRSLHDAAGEEPSNPSASDVASDDSKSPSLLRLTLTILQPSLVNFLCSFTNGTITVGLPVIARSLALERSLYLWPSSVYGLTSGSMLLIAGSIADLVGARRVELLGIFLMGIFTLACGLSATGVQLVVFRALQGIATAMHLPASVALVAAGVPQGKARNIGFGCLGLSQPLGFSVGLVVSGIMIDRAGWRSSFYLSGGATLAASIAAVWMLPKVKPEHETTSAKELFTKIATEIDWVGGLLASGGLAMVAYVLAILSADLSAIHSATTATLLSLGLVLLVAFPLWMHHRERVGKPALVPNSLWRNLPFTSTCMMVLLSYGVTNAMELFSSLYFQEIQNASTLTTSLYLLPNLLVGVMINLTVGLLVHRLPARWLVAVASLLSAISTMMMALANPKWSYWLMEFWAQVFSPISADVLFTVGLIIVSDNFPEKTQGLAGGVFNTVAQFGMSLGIGVCQVVALGVSGPSSDDTAQLKGYRASFWTMFAYMVVCSVIAVVGLRKAGKVGLKTE